MKELMMIQQKLNAPKDKYNSFGKYSYRSCEGILEALKPLLAEQECTLVVSDDIFVAGNRIYVKATATITNKDGVEVSATAYAREEEAKKGMDSSQLTGATSSYARKYALNGLFCIDDNKDADETNTHGKEQPQPPKLSPEQMKQAYAELEACKSINEVQLVFNKYEALNSSFTAKGTPFFNKVKEICNKLKAA